MIVQSVTVDWGVSSSHRGMREAHGGLEADMESLYLKTLIEVTRTGSFSQAADNLCVTQSAVSRRVKFVEEHYGCPLVDRSGPVVKATPAGQMVVEKAKEILHLERELIGRLSSLDSKPRFSFACTPTFGVCFLPEVLETFMLNNQDLVDLRVNFDVPENLLSGLTRGIYDLVVMDHCDGLDLAAFHVYPLPADELVFVSRADSGIPDTLPEVNPLLEMVLFTRKDGNCSRILLDANMKQAGASASDFHRVIVLDDLRLIIDTVREGRGIAFISTDAVATDVAAGLLREHRVAGFQHKRSRSVVTNPEAADDPLLDAFRKIVEDCFPQAAVYYPPGGAVPHESAA